MSTSVRSMVQEIQREVLQTDLAPQRAAELLAKLTALLASTNTEIREADMFYARVLLEYLGRDEAANRAKIRAETSPEYQRKREARDCKEFVIEMIRSLKVILRCAEEEMRLGTR